MGTLAAIGGFLRLGLGVFTTVSREKRAARIALLREALTASGVKKRSVFGWALVFLAFAALLYDVVVTGGDNFETLLQLMTVALSA